MLLMHHIFRKKTCLEGLNSMRKKILPIGAIIITLLFLISGVNALSITQNNDMPDNSTPSADPAHTVFCEFAVISDLENCPETAELLQNIYDSGEYDFKYITYVTDQHTEATNWFIDQYKIAGYPTCIFDGGYDVLYKSPISQDAYENKIYISSYRNVHDLDVVVNTRWAEDCCSQKLNMDITVTNNEDTKYTGILKVYIVERNSRWTYQIEEEIKPYQFAFLDLAMDENIVVPAGETVTFPAPQWVPFIGGVVDAGNLFAIAVISNKNPYSGYSDPPYNENEFSSHAVDEVAVKKIRKKVAKSEIDVIGKSFEIRFQFIQGLLQKLIQDYPLLSKLFF